MVTKENLLRIIVSIRVYLFFLRTKHTNCMKTTTEINQSVLGYAINSLGNRYEGTYGCDLHNELFNTDYFIIGRYQAESLRS